MQNRDIGCGAVKSVPPNSWEEVKYRYFQYYRYPIYANFKKLFLVQDILLLSVGMQLKAKKKRKKKRPKRKTQIHECEFKYRPLVLCSIPAAVLCNWGFLLGSVQDIDSMSVGLKCNLTE